MNITTAIKTKKRGRPLGSKTKNRSRRPRRPSSQTHQLHQPETPMRPETTETTVISLVPPSLDSANSSSSTDRVEDHIERFETIAATVPDAIGGSDADGAGVNGTPDLIEDPAGQPDALVNAEGMVLINEKAMRYYMGFAFNQIARATKDDRWKLETDELDAAAPVTVDLVAKWMPALLTTSAYKEEIAFAIVMFGIVGPRLQMPKKPTNTAGTVTPES